MEKIYLGLFIGSIAMLLASAGCATNTASFQTGSRSVALSSGAESEALDANDVARECERSYPRHVRAYKSASIRCF